MSKAAEAGLMNAEMVLRVRRPAPYLTPLHVADLSTQFREGDLRKAIEKMQKEQAKETKELLKVRRLPLPSPPPTPTEG